MTAITPLEFVHKKGIFGDHHKKKESDLLKISELKNLTIIQLVQYNQTYSHSIIYKLLVTLNQVFISTFAQ